MNVLLIGGTGVIGRPLVPMLLSAGVYVRVMSRTSEHLYDLPAGAAGIRGDLDHAESLRAAMTGVDALVLITPHTIAETGQGLAAVQTAFAAGIRRIIFASSMMPAGSTRVPGIASKLAIENTLIFSRVDYTIVRINDLFQNDERYEEAILHGLYPRPIGDTGVSRVDAIDVAHAMAGAVLLGHCTRRIISCSGPEVLTGESVAETWSRHLGRNVLYTGDDLARWDRTTGTKLLRWQRDDERALYRYLQENGLVADPSQQAAFERLIDRPLRTFDEYAADSAASWRSATPEIKAMCG